MAQDIQQLLVVLAGADMAKQDRAGVANRVSSAPIPPTALSFGRFLPPSVPDYKPWASTLEWNEYHSGNHAHRAGRSELFGSVTSFLSCSFANVRLSTETLRCTMNRRINPSTIVTTLDSMTMRMSRLSDCQSLTTGAANELSNGRTTRLITKVRAAIGGGK